MTGEEKLDDLMRALHMVGNPEEEKIAAWLRKLEEANEKIQKVI